MDRNTVFTKTAKGITQVNQRSASLSKDLMKVLKLIDGKSNFGQLLEKADVDKNVLEKALNTLTKDGFARVFQTKKEDLDLFGDEGGDDFDFTAPGKMPAATQRVIPGAANDISELVRQQAKSDADRKAKEQAHTQAAAKAKAEAQVRAKLEAEAKARQEAERQAMEQAQKAKEAAERARAQVEAQKREEEARQKAIAEQQVKLTAEQKAKEEAESRRLAELRVKAEREAKALAEARARAEAEAAAMAKARAEAEAAAKKQAEEATNAQAEMKARLKEEIEARIRGEMEELLKTEVEDKTRESMKAEIMAEAKLAAQAELEERLAQERESIAKAEAEARTKAEAEARARAESESKKRAEAEARAKAETEARIRAEEETKRLRAQMEQESRRAAEAAERAKADAEARARESAEIEKRLEAERQAKYEAEARAKVEAEERAKRERELSATIEAERKAKEDAEARARIEAKARETIAEDTRAKVQAELESDLEKKAEIEGKAQAKAYMQAKVKAEEEEEQKIRDEQAKRAREIAEVLRTRVETEEKAEAAAPKRRAGGAGRAGSIVKLAVLGTIALVVVAIGLLHIVPLRPYTAKVERTLAEWLQDDVAIGSMTFRLAPSPHLRVENVAVGKSLDAKAASGRVDLAILSLFGDKPSINSIELENITLTPEAVKRIPRWGRAEGKGEAGGIERISLRGVKLEVKPPLEPFNATMTFERNGVLRQAVLNAPSGWAVTLKPAEQGMEFDATARNLNLPIGPAFPVADSRFKGTLVGNQIVVPEYEIETMGGTVKGSLKISWDQNVKLESEMAVAKINAGELVAAFTKAIVITGKMDGGFTFATEGPDLEKIFAAPRAQGKFRVGEGSISNVDLVAVMQSESAGTRAGVTKYNEIAGELAYADHRSSLNRLSLEGGVLRSSGSVEVGQGGNLAGRLQIEMRSRVSSDRGSFSLTGSVSRPILKRN
jgi:hypothetical protein